MSEYPTLEPSPWQPAAPPAGSTWADFAGWVIWLDRAYELELPQCWALHEGLVHSLAALWHLWRSVYAAPGENKLPAAGGPAAWHIQYLYPWRDRLLNEQVPGGRCRTREHRGYTPRVDLPAALEQQLQEAAATDPRGRTAGQAEQLGAGAVPAHWYPVASYTGNLARARLAGPYVS